MASGVQVNNRKRRASWNQLRAAARKRMIKGQSLTPEQKAAHPLADKYIPGDGGNYHLIKSAEPEFDPSNVPSHHRLW